MFTNLGKKIKMLGMIWCWVGIVGSIIAGLILVALSLISVGLLIMLLGPVLCWLSSWGICGYGELLENTYEIKQALTSQMNQPDNLSRNYYGGTQASSEYHPANSQIDKAKAYASAVFYDHAVQCHICGNKSVVLYKCSFQNGQDMLVCADCLKKL